MYSLPPVMTIYHPSRFTISDQKRFAQRNSFEFAASEPKPQASGLCMVVVISTVVNTVAATSRLKCITTMTDRVYIKWLIMGLYFAVADSILSACRLI